MSGCDSTDKVKQLLRAMARAKIKEGHTDPDVILSHIHDAISDHTPLHRGEIADIITGHGGAKATRSELQQRMAAFYKELRDRHKVPPDVNAIRNKARQKVIEKEIAKIQSRLDAGDFRKAEPRKSPLYTTETQKAQARLNDLRAEYERAAHMAKRQNRSTAAKVADMVVELHRAAVLTSPNVLLKLPATALSNIAIRPGLLEPVGQGLRRLPGLRGIAEKARSEGGAAGYFGTEGAALKRTFSGETLRAMNQMRKTGTHELQSLYGGRNDKDFNSDFKLTQLVGNIHGMLKVPAAINHWSRAVQHISEAEARAARRAGMSEEQVAAHMVDQATQARIGAEAWLEGQREIFQNDNMLSDAYEAMLGRLHGAAEKGSTSAAIAERTFRFFLPITKVPTNIGIAASSYAGGAIGALAQIAAAARQGARDVKSKRAVDQGIWKNAVNALTPQQANSIMRNLKRQTVGIAAMAIGAYLYKNFGGMYQQGDSRNPLKPDSETIRVNGFNITKQVLEHPLLTAMQLGATVAWVANKPKGDIPAGLLGAAKGLAEKNPFVNEAATVGKAFTSTKEMAKFAGQTVGSMNPQMLQWIARKTDVDSTGKEIKRRPQTFVQELESGIPGARKYVPRSPNQ